MLSTLQQAAMNLDDARGLRASGHSYRPIGRRLGLSSGQLGHIRRALKREKAAHTRLRSRAPNATDRDLPVSRSVLPAGLRKILIAGGYSTLGDLADRIADPNRSGFETLPGIGPYRAALVTRLLDHYGLLAGTDDLRDRIEQLFPELADPRHAKAGSNGAGVDV